MICSHATIAEIEVEISQNDRSTTSKQVSRGKQKLIQPQRMATRPAEEGMTEGSSTVTVEEAPAQAPVLHLHGAEGSSRGVRWGAEVVDNEGMGKRKSKCCCIYKKPKKWDESDEDESDCETGDCRGHVERKPHAHPHTPPKPDQSAPS